MLCEGELWEVKPKNEVGGERKLEFALRMIQLSPYYSGKYSVSWTTSTCGHSLWIMRQGTRFATWGWHELGSTVTGQEPEWCRAGRACSMISGTKRQPMFCPQFEVWLQTIEALCSQNHLQSPKHEPACCKAVLWGRKQANTKMLSSATRSWMLIPGLFQRQS